MNPTILDRTGARRALLLLASLLIRCGSEAPPDRDPAAPISGGEGRFAVATTAAGIDFVHRNCGTGRKYLVEINAGGVSLLDYDGDGRLDILFAQGAPLPGYERSDEDLRDRLYRNLGDLRFEDVTDAAGASEPGYTYSIAAPDIDGDGDPDLYFSNFGPNRLLRNEGGRFVDATVESGLGGGDHYSVATAFLDLDQDGDLDAYVCNYVEGVLEIQGCASRRGEAWRTYCSPDEFPGARDQVFRNDDGHFVDVTEAAGMGASDGAGLGIVPCDFDQDGDVDLFISNDSRPNFLWRNDGGLRFTDVAWEAGVAVAGSGMSEACMGADAGDIDHDGDFDLFVTNLAMETNTLYRQVTPWFFEDGSVATGLGPPSLRHVGFGCRLFDADNDGDHDIMVVNGHVIDNPELHDPAVTFLQPPRFYQNRGDGTFEDASEQAGAYFRGQYLGRGLAIGDLDDDGDLDAVICNNNAAAALLANQTRSARWIGFHLHGGGKNTQALGARVVIQTAAGTQREEVRGTASYAAFQDLRVHFGLGEEDRILGGTVFWPDGAATDLGERAAGSYHSVRQE